MEQRQKMKRHGWSGIAVALIAALVWVSLPATSVCAEAGNDSAGAMVAAGLVITIVVVYGLVSLRSDVERYTEADTEKAIAHAVKMAEGSPIVFKTITAPIGLQTSGAENETEIAGAGIGWRMSF